MRIALAVALACTVAHADSALPDLPAGIGKVRPGASVTRLLDGRVLIAGGEVRDPQMGELPVDTVEIWSPRTRRRAAAASLNAPRSYHSATLLRDGRVLVIGGTFDESDAMAEVFSPASGRFRIVAPAPALNAHTATLLPDGRVLVIGGRPALPCDITRSEARLFDPASDRFEEAGRLATSRMHHAAALLEDGRVLVVGGRHYEPSRFCNMIRPDPVLDAEVWDPKTRAFSPAGRLLEWRDGVLRLEALPGGGARLSGGAVQVTDADGDCLPVSDEDQRCRTRPADVEEWRPATRDWIRK